MEDNAKNAIIEAIKRYIKDMQKQPTIVNIDLDTAYDLMKLGRNELGELSELFAKQGLEALKNRRIWGVSIHVEPKINGIRCE